MKLSNAYHPMKMRGERNFTTTLLRSIMFLLMMVGMEGAWGQVCFEAKNRIGVVDNNDGTFTATAANNAGDQYALAIADLSDIAGITAENAVVKVEFDCRISSGSRWLIGIGDKNTRGENANGSNKSTYNTDGVIMRFGTTDGTNYRVNGGTADNSAFGILIHATVSLNKETSKYSYTLKNGETTLFSGSNISTSVTNLTIIEAYTWQSYATITLSNVKVNDNFYFPKQNDVMYIEDMVYDSPLVNEPNHPVTYTITGNDDYFRTATNATPFFPFYPKKTSGNNVVTISANTLSYNLSVGTRNEISASSLVTDETFDVGNAVGMIMDECVTVGTGLTLYFGKDTETQVIRNDGNKAVVCIDENGYTHTYWPDWNKEKEPTMGTFFKLVVSTPKTLVVDGYFASPTDEQVLLRKAKGDGTLEQAIMNITNPNDGTLARGEVTLTEVGTYYLCSQTGTFSLRSLIYTDIQATFNYPDAIDGIAFFSETLTNPTIQATDLSTDTDISNYYSFESGSFTSSQPTIATISNTTGTITTTKTKGATIITSNLTSNDTEKYSNLTDIRTTLYVTDGSWNLTGFTSTEANTLNPEWVAGTYRKERTTSNFSPILKTDGSFFEKTAGLQTSGFVRYYYQSPGYIVLVKGTSGSKLRFPVRAGMTVTFNANAVAEEEFSITNVTDMDGNYVEGFYATTDRQDFNFMAEEDGYVTIFSSGQNLNLYSINACANMAFEDGTEVFLTQATTNYSNEVKNQGTTTLAYALSDPNQITTGFDTSTGIITGFNNFGDVTVTVTGSGTGLLAGATENYTIHVVDLNIINSSIAQEIGDNGTKTITNLASNVKVVINSSNDTSETFKSNVAFTVADISKSTTRAIINQQNDGTYTLTVIGTGTITIKATLGLIEKTYTYVISGPEFENYMAVTTNDVDSYIMKLEDGATDITYSISTEAVKGDLDGTKLSIDSEGKITGILAAKNDDTSGGAIQVIAHCTYGGNTKDVYGVLTVAYTEHEWKLDNTLTLTDYPTTANTPTSSWTKTANGSSWVNYYNSVTKGDNALMMEETAGLQTISSVGRIGTTTSEDGTDKKDLTVSQGTVLIIPQVKPGRWIDINWVRHNPGQGERFRCTNLLDVDGKEITDILRIGSTAGSGSDYQGTYSFQVKGDPEGDPVDVTITALDNAWTAINCIQLHDRTNYVSTMYDTIHTPYPSTGAPTKYIWDDGETHEARYGHNLFQNSPNAPYRYTVTTDATLNATIEMNGWYSERGAFYEDPVIKYRSGWGKYYITLSSYSSDYKYVVGRRTWTLTVGRKPTQTYPYTWDFTKYFSSTKAGVESDGTTHKDEENRPEMSWATNTWDTPTTNQEKVNAANYNSSRYESYFIDNAQLVCPNVGSLPETEGLGFSITNKTAGGLTLDMNSTVTDQPRISTYTLNGSAVSFPLSYFTYDTDGQFNFNSKFTNAEYDGISFTKGLKMESTTKIIFTSTKPSTITIVQSTWSDRTIKFDDTTLPIGMATSGTGCRIYTINNVTAGTHTITRGNGESGLFYIKVIENYSSSGTKARKSTQRKVGATTKNGKLIITGGGTITVPAPKENGYYIYIKSNVEPSTVSNTTTNDRDDVNIESGQYSYKIDNKDTDVIITFNSDAEVYAIGVTNILKTLEKITNPSDSTTLDGWATESRNVNIDHFLTGHLTTNDVNAYVVNHDTYTDEKATVSMAAIAEDGYVPANTGIVLKQGGMTGVSGDLYNVPFFVPAVTTSQTSTTTAFGIQNRMYPNVNATIHDSEIQTIDGTKYTKFILAKRFMTWIKNDDNTASHGNFITSRDVATFYRMHKYDETIGSEDATTLNTLGANKAYLLLPTSSLPDALWSSSSGAPRRYIAIEGVSDMEELEELEEEERQRMGDGRIYNLRGQLMSGDEQTLPAGVYIRNGKKFVVK